MERTWDEKWQVKTKIKDKHNNIKRDGLDGANGRQKEEGMKKHHGRRRDITPLGKGDTPIWVVKEPPLEVLTHSR